MPTGLRFAALLAVLAAFLSPASAQTDPLEAGRALTAAFWEERIADIWDRMTPTMREALGGEEDLRGFQSSVKQQLGAEEEVLAEQSEERAGMEIYLRTSTFSKIDRPVLTQWTFDRNGKVSGFFIRPVQEAAESRFLDYETKADLRLPFDGDWYVFWGGRTVADNYHAVDPAQRFAYDFLAVRNGETHSGTGDDVSDYRCWDRPILAPAGGRVVAAIDRFPDNRLGEMDPAHPAGNHVVLDLGNDEYAFLAHLREGSVTVEEGERVEAGQEVGRCGNSGNSSEPHLHFHLQNTPDLKAGEGLPAFFNDYVADGERVEHGEPARGETVSPAS